MSRVLRAAALAVLAAFVASAPSGAGAADALDAGWWWRVQSGQGVTLPAPPSVEADQLLVQGAADGATAVAAVRFRLGEGEGAAALQLRVAESSRQAAAAAVVLACPATTGWRSGQAQPWPEKPVPDCTQQAVGEPSDDGATMTFDLSAIAAGSAADGDVDLVLVPGVVEGLPEGVNGSSFSLVFEATDDADLVTSAAGAPTTSPGSGFAGSGSPTAGADGGAAPAAGSGSSSGSGSSATTSFRPPAAPVAPALPADEVAGPQSPAASTAAGGAASGTAAGVPGFAPVADDTGDAKVLAVVLLLGAAAAALLGGRRTALLQLLGGVAAPGAEPAVAGVGRLARAREGAPPSLR